MIKIKKRRSLTIKPNVSQPKAKKVTAPVVHHKGKQAPDVNIPGKSVASDFQHNCITCSAWSVCRDIQKSARYRCSKYAEASIDMAIDDIGKLLDAEGLPIEDPLDYSGEDDIGFENSGEEDVYNMLDRILKQNLPVPPDLRINDGDIKTAPNFFTWATDSQFAGGAEQPFMRQLEIGSKVYGEVCPRCSDRKWYESKIKVNTTISEFLDRVQLLEYGICPKCKVTRSELVVNREMYEYYSLIGIAGQRSGKTSSVTLWEGYNMHKMVTLPSPQQVFGTLSSQPLIGTFAALTFNQAVTNIWVPFRNILTQNTWFRNYHEFLTTRGHELGEELFHLAENSIRYRHRNITYAPQGPNKRTMRGASRCCCFPAGMKVSTLEGGLMDISDPDLVGHRVVVGGESYPITNHMNNGVQKIVHIELDDNSTIRCTPEHKFMVWDSLSLKRVLKPIKEVTHFDYLIKDLKTSNAHGLLAETVTTDTLAPNDYYEFLLKANQETKLRYLARVYESSSKRGGRVVLYAKKSKNEIKLIQRLLHSFGIPSKASTYIPVATTAFANVGTVTLGNGYHSLEFLRLIYPYVAKLQEKPLSYYTPRGRMSIDSISSLVIPGSRVKVATKPIQVRTTIPELNNIQNYSLESLKGDLTDEQRLSIRQLNDCHYSFHRIRKIDWTKPEMVYDITVDSEEHIYLCEGIQVSNSVIDEICWFPLAGKNNQELERLDVKGVDIALTRSMLTVKSGHARRVEAGFNNLPKPIKWAVSSPQSINDYGMSLHRKAQGSKEVYHYKYCISGDSILRTPKGLKRIDEIILDKYPDVDITKRQTLDVDFKVLGPKGLAKVSKWHCTGKKRIVTVELDNGHYIKVTKQHKMRCLRDGVEQWIKAGNLKPSDMLVHNYEESSRKSKLRLSNIKQSDNIKIGKNGFYKSEQSANNSNIRLDIPAPKYMTPDLAYLLGCLCSEGHSACDNRKLYFTVYDKKFFNHFIKVFQRVFKFKPKIFVKGERLTTVIQSKTLGKWFTDLGHTTDLARDKRVPSSILKADKESVLGYLAGYIDGDGHAKKENLAMYSSSPALIKGLSDLIESVGVNTTIRFNSNRLDSSFTSKPKFDRLEGQVVNGVVEVTSPSNAKKFYELLQPYQYITPKNVARIKTRHTPNGKGIPKKYFMEFMASRLIRQVGRSDESIGRVFEADNTDNIHENDYITGWSSFAKRNVNKGWSEGTVFNYEDLDNGRYDELLNLLKAISPKVHSDFMRLWKDRKHYRKVRCVFDSGVEYTYDLTMKNSKLPSYIANSIEVSNSTWKFNPLLRKQDFAEEYRTDPIAAARDYECNPPIGEGLFINDSGTVLNSENYTHNNAFSIVSKLGISKSGSRITVGQLTRADKVNNPHGTLLCIDVGLVNNSFAISIISLPPNYIEGVVEDDEDELIKPVRVIGCGEIIPLPGTKISLTKLYKNVLAPLTDFYNVKYVVSDRWQNVKIMSDLEEDFGVESIEYRCKWEDFLITREIFQQATVDMPTPSMTSDEIINVLMDDYPAVFIRKPVDHLLWQLLNVREHTNVTVSKPDYGTDDLFRTLVLGATLLQDEEVFEDIYLNGEAHIVDEDRGPRALTVGASKGIKSTRSGQVGSSNVALSRSHPGRR